MEKSSSPVILAGLFCADYTPDQAGAYVRLYNSGAAPADLSGMVLEWDGVALAFPAGQPVGSGQSRFVAWNADAFKAVMTHAPDYALSGGSGSSALKPVGEAPRALKPEGGSVRLLSAAGEVLDACVWGTGAPVRGWNGPALAPVRHGVVYQRAVLEESVGPASPGRFVADPGSAAAWRQGSDWLPRRLVRAGQSEWTYPTYPASGATAFVCPDNAFGVISQFLDQATHSLDINLYLFTQSGLADHIEGAIQRGVAVRLLMEGEPYEGVPQSDVENVSRLQQAGAVVRILHAASDGFKRYHYDHAKYAVADGARCLVMSDNWTHTSVPDRPVTGHRGWGVVLESAELAAHLTGIFEGDWNPASGDSLVFDDKHIRVPSGAQPPAQSAQHPIADPVRPASIDGPVPATVFVAPEHALLETKAICGLIRSSTQTLDVLQASLQLFWEYGDTGSVDATPDLFLSEVVAAARRGVKVRVLMDGAYLDSQDPRDNGHTREWLQALAEKEQLPLEARVLDYHATGMGIHDKGLISDGKRVLISSINWSENSPLENREMGLILENTAVAQYYTAVFDRDWAGGN